MIAEKCSPSGRQATDEANALRLAKDWLGERRNGRWLLVVDGADNQAVLSAETPATTDSRSEIAAKGVIRFLPDCQHGSMLFTTRDEKVAFNIGPRTRTHHY